MTSVVRAAFAQIALRLGKLDHNLERCTQAIDEAASQRADLLVLPECALSGFVFATAEDAARAAVTIPGPEIDEIAMACAGRKLVCVLGVLERDAADLWNSAVVISGDGVLGRYRKTHLVDCGADCFVRAGEMLDGAHPTTAGCIGLEVCFDLRFPEVTRALAHAGAEIVAHPTSWYGVGRQAAEILTIARALENGVFLVSANRVGSERGTRFVGRSQIVDPQGCRLAYAGTRAETVETRDIDLSLARSSTRNAFRSRRPTIYSALVASTHSGSEAST